MIWQPHHLLGLLLASIAILSPDGSVAHVALMQPAARQVVNKVGIIQRSYTTFGGAGDTYGLNANVFGGPSGPEQLRLYGYDLCGDDGRRKAFSIPSAYGFAPTQPQMTIEAGKPFEVLTHFTTHHLGWMEFRLCAPEAGKTVVTSDTAACFKQHVLKLDTQQYYTASHMPTGVRSVFDFEGTPEAGYNFHHAKCQQSPPNTCCDADSGCSPENANVHRFMLPRQDVDNNYFRVRLIAPADVTCERCTLQMTYRTGNSPDSFPETFWNCADIAVVPAGSNPNQTPAPTSGQTNTATKAPTVKTASPTAQPTVKTSSPTAQPTMKGDTKQPTKKPTSASPTKKPTTASPTKKITSTPTKKVTATPTKKSTNQPTTLNQCAQTWGQCGGQGFTGAQCCLLSTDECAYTNDHWSMCTPKATVTSGTKAPSLRPTASPSLAGCAATWGQCGGQGFTGNKCCASANDACVYDNDWWSMCKPK